MYAPQYWYPQFAVFDDVEGWVADRYRGNGEFYMEHADYDLHVTAPVGYLVRATGELQNPAQVLTPRARDALALAAQQREVVHVIDADDHAAGKVTNDSPTGKLTWHFRAERVRDVAVSIARTYLWDATHAVVKDQHGPGQDGTCMIHAVYEANAGDWVRAAEYARHTIEFMSAQLHPYPWPHMTACEGIIGGGMEYPMMTICGGRRPAGVIAHELCHMWFPMLVGSNEKRYAWQDEGFTSFWTTLVRDDFTGATNGPKRDVLSYVNAVRRGDDAVCMRHADTYGDDDFGFATYGKTAAVLHQLRARLGDEVFFAAFRRYTHDWAFKHPYPYDFFRCFATTAGQDLEPYFRTWFYETWRLDHVIQVVVEVDGGTEVTIVDQGRALHPAVVEATFADGQKQRQTVPESTWQANPRATLRFGPGVVEVVIDPDTTSLDSNRDDNRWRRPEPAK
ncbi:MAG: M1 family metallopeptidase [Planctomycetes bacterium]|nr:M1 family metallopeptidase [Planctomycetota bacterium]MCC7399610.1 M1 family metallopeptidase [Planctomycetota bacterium]